MLDESSNVYRYKGSRVKMVCCIAEEPAPPTVPEEFEEFCESGNSGRPVQTHVGDYGIVSWINEDDTICVLFNDGDERVVYEEEVSFIL